MFRRRNAAAAPAADLDEAQPYGTRAVIAHRKAQVPAYTDESAGGSGHVPRTNGWAPFGQGQSPVQQIGAYDGPPANQYPALIPGVQRHQGVEFLNSRYYVPSRSAVPIFQQTQQHVNLPGPQLDASRYTGAIGPVTARLFRRNVTSQSIQQSALRAEPWMSINNGGVE